MARPWGKMGAWAAEAERAEAEEKEAEMAAAAAADAAEGGPQSFPSLKEAVSTKTKKKKATMSLSEFNTGAYASSSGAFRQESKLEYKGLTPDEMIRLPTGPKERSAEEYGRLGGGFSSYGRSGYARNHDRGSNDESSWSGNRRSYGGFDEDRRTPISRFSDLEPSRADEVDNWTSEKKSLSFRSSDSSRSNRYTLGGAAAGGSRADEIDNWAMAKKPAVGRSDTFGYGFRDSGPGPDRWTRGGGSDNFERERPKLVLDPPRGNMARSEPVKSNRPNPFGSARPREEVLAEKGLDWKKLDTEIESKKSSRPASSQSSRPSSAQSSLSDGTGLQGVDGAKPRPKVNPFGDAKPREVLLEEKGEDWRKIDLELEHRRVDRVETEAEKVLKEGIKELQKEIKKGPADATEETYKHMEDLLVCKEKELEELVGDLDDKVRFGPKAVERPGSGMGRPGSRPPSRAGSFEDSRSVDFGERPRSRGGGDVWMRPAEDRGGFLSNRDGAFLGRPRSGDRW